MMQRKQTPYQLVLLEDAPSYFAVIPQKNEFRVVVVLRRKDDNAIAIPLRSIPLKLTLLYENKSSEDYYEVVSDQSILRCSSRRVIGLCGRAELDLRVTENSNNSAVFEKRKASTDHHNKRFVVEISIMDGDYSIEGQDGLLQLHNIDPVHTAPIYVLARDKATRMPTASKQPSEISLQDTSSIMMLENYYSKKRAISCVPPLESDTCKAARSTGNYSPTRHESVHIKQIISLCVCIC